MSGCNFQTQTGAEHFNLYLITQVKLDMMLQSFSATLQLTLRKRSKFLLRNQGSSQETKIQCINAVVVFNQKFHSFSFSQHVHSVFIKVQQLFLVFVYLLVQWGKIPVLHQSCEVKRLIKSLAAANLKIIMEIHFSLLFIIQIQVIFALRCH